MGVLLSQEPLRAIMKIQQHKRCQNHEVLARAKPTGAERALHKEPQSLTSSTGPSAHWLCAWAGLVSPSVNGTRIPPGPPPAGQLGTCQTSPLPTYVQPTCLWPPPQLEGVKRLLPLCTQPSLTHSLRMPGLGSEVCSGRPLAVCMQHLCRWAHMHREVHTSHLHTQMCTTC